MCSICCVNTRIQSLKVWLKSILSWLKYSIFSRGVFYWRTLYTTQHWKVLIILSRKLFEGLCSTSIFWLLYLCQICCVFFLLCIKIKEIIINCTIPISTHVTLLHLERHPVVPTKYNGCICNKCVYVKRMLIIPATPFHELVCTNCNRRWWPLVAGYQMPSDTAPRLQCKQFTTLADNPVFTNFQQSNW